MTKFEIPTSIEYSKIIEEIIKRTSKDLGFTVVKNNTKKSVLDDYKYSVLEIVYSGNNILLDVFHLGKYCEIRNTTNEFIKKNYPKNYKS